MKNKLYMNFIKLLFIVFSIFVISKILSILAFKRTRAQISVDGMIYNIRPYKNLPLKFALDKNHIVINSYDVISHDINKPIKPLEIVKIIRVKKEQKETNGSTLFKVMWSKKYDTNLRKIELQRGVEKNIRKKEKKTFYDSILHSTNALNERITAKEYYRLVIFGKDDAIEKIYDLSKAKKIKMVATAYYPGDPLAWKDGTITFLGQKMQRGIVAVDPKIIPLKTRLFIPGYGYGYAGDIGSFIKGRRIDLGVENVRDEKIWMFKDVTVYILEKAETY
jgi:3D (Asp-Asp-Asp) domain-containing protein